MNSKGRDCLTLSLGNMSISESANLGELIFWHFLHPLITILATRRYIIKKFAAVESTPE